MKETNVVFANIVVEDQTADHAKRKIVANTPSILPNLGLLIT